MRTVDSRQEVSVRTRVGRVIVGEQSRTFVDSDNRAVVPLHDFYSQKTNNTTSAEKLGD